jgi:hypothetical protein
LAAAAAASPRILFRWGLPLPVRPAWVRTPDWMVRGLSLAHDTRCPGMAKTHMVRPISAMIT